MWRKAFALVYLFATLSLSAAVARAEPLDFDLPGGGHFYKQANGQGGQGETGYAITDDAGIPFWSTLRQLGGPEVLGYPASQRLIWDGFVIQVLQKVVLQWHPETRTVAFLNVLDLQHDRGLDDWLLVYRMTPRPFDTSPDTGLSWEAVEQRHWAMLNANAAIRARYFGDPFALDHFGLPVGSADLGNAFVVRAQRVVFQYWKEDVPWARRGEVTVANGGDLLKETVLANDPAMTPTLPRGGAPTARDHAWRTPGYVAAVGGLIYDRNCVPLRSAGINAPNLLYRAGQDDTLAWMRDRRLRWVRVFVSGHRLGADRAPTDAASAAASLRAFLARVEDFNARHGPEDSIYVLVSLTDYYPPGVPGDGYAFDHPVWAGSPVLPAPWYRAGVRQFDFDQEHGAGIARALPNYEVNYLPWVRQIVSSVAGSPALFGWQLGNELKARGSERNGISSAQAYDWYTAFTRDVVDTIRTLDRNHLIVMGAQYMAELVDWEYRPQGGLASERVPTYRNVVQQMLAACGRYCWNVWGLTMYDFNPYASDDARLFAQAGVASLASEYGFTRGTDSQMQQRFGGDRAAAVANGLARAWTDLDGQMQPREWSAAELVTNAPLAAIAPWGSPAPGFEAALDVDAERGVTGTPDEAPLWNAWVGVATKLEQANRAAGVSAPCMAKRTP